MKKVLLVLVPALIICATIPNAAIAQNSPDKIFNLSVTAADVQILGEGLGTLPYGKVAPLMSKLQAQINEQSQPKPEAKPVEVPKAGEDIPK